MFDALLKKMLSSRKFATMAVTLLLKVLAPLATKWGFDLSFIEEALNDWMPVILLYIGGQSVVDAATAAKNPA